MTVKQLGSRVGMWLVVTSYRLCAGEFDRGVITPNQLRWRPFAIPSDSVDFVRGLTTICGAGSAGKKDGFAIHVYTASISMHHSCLANADGDILIVPQQGVLTFVTQTSRHIYLCNADCSNSPCLPFAMYCN